MVEKGPGMITDEVRATLKMAACELSLKKWDRMPIASDVCDGLIETQWDTHSVGGRTGVLFRTQITEEKGDYFVNFLLNSSDLERGAEILRQMQESEGVNPWSTGNGTLPCPALYEFHDLRTKRLGRSLH